MKKTFICFFSLIISSACAQPPGEWMWIHGTNLPNAVGNFGVLGVPSPANVPPGMYEACEWTDLNGNFWLFGGANGTGGRYSVMWKYDPAINQWTWIHGPNTPNFVGNYGVQGVPAPTNVPPARSHGMGSCVDNAGNLWMFGGLGPTGGLQSDLWKYDIATNQWTWMRGPNTTNNNGVYGTQGVPNIANDPGCRRETGAMWGDNSGNLWLFGGYRNGGMYNDLCRYNIATNTWTWMKGSNTTGQPGVYGVQGLEAPANTPGARMAYCRWMDNTGNLWLFGGGDYLGNVYFSDLWRYNPVTNNWAWMSGPTAPNANSIFGAQCNADSVYGPGGRFENRIAWKDLNGNFWTFGGARGGSLSTGWNDLWMYCVSTNEWSWQDGPTLPNTPGNWGAIGVPNPANLPYGRGGAPGWVNQSGELYVWGGWFFSGSYYNDLWRYVIDPNCYTCSTLLLPLVITMTNDTAVCLGTCASVGATVTGGDPPYTYAWTPNIGNGPGPYTVCPTVTTTYYLLVTDSMGATETDSVTVTVNPLPVITTSSPAAVCLGDSVLLTVSGALMYTWSPCTSLNPCTGSSVTAWPAVTSTYTVTGIDVNGCIDSVNYVVNVNPNPVPVITPSGSPEFCIGNSVDLTVNPTGSYLWSNGDISQTVNITQSGTFVVTVTDVNGCIGVSPPQDVIVHPLPVLSSTASGVLCNGGSTGSITVNAAAGTPPYTYQWTPSGGISSTENNLQAGNYTVLVTDSFGCSETLTDTVTEPPPVTVIMSSLNSDCDSINGQADVLPAGGTPGYTYVWSNSQTTDTISGIASGVYTVTVTDANNCSVTDSVSVGINLTNLNIVAIQDTTIYLGASIQLYAEGGYSYKWLPATALSCYMCQYPISTPTKSMTYCVTVYDSGGICYDTACMRITVLVKCEDELFVPDAFSPNDDGMNDVLFAYGHGLKDFYFVIYDRWGEKVFETTDNTKGWDGNYKGKPLDPAVFVYVLRAACVSGFEITQKGNISLFR